MHPQVYGNKSPLQFLIERHLIYFGFIILILLHFDFNDNPTEHGNP